MINRPVGIGGIGVFSACGDGLAPLWDALASGRSAVRAMTLVEPTGMGCELAAEIPGLDARELVPKHYRKATKVMARDTQIAVACAQRAVDDACLATRSKEAAAPTYAPDRLGCHIGAGLIAAETNELVSALATSTKTDDPLRFDMRAWGTEHPELGARGGMNNLQPLWLLKYLPNMLACHVSIIHGAEGPSNTITCAEASSLLSVGEACRAIERGQADASLAGGCESKLNLMGLTRMRVAGQLAALRRDQAENVLELVRPFDPKSAGAIPGESGAVFALEAIDSMASRGRTPRCVVAGFGAAMGSVPAGEYEPRGVHDGLATAIARALDDAGLTARDIDILVPQGTGHASTDAAEVTAIVRVLGDSAPAMPRVDLVPIIGLSWASQGAVQLAIASECLVRGCMPRHQFVRPPRHALVCSHALGGLAAAVVLAHPGVLR